MKKTKAQSGITLVALIITIIVLLILAIVSIRAIQDGGILTKAQIATGKYTEAEEKEKIELAKMAALMDAYKNGNGTIQKEVLETELAKQFKNGEFALAVDEATGDFLITMASGRKYSMAKQGGAITYIKPGDWAQNGDKITNSKTGQTKNIGDTMTNAEVLAALSDDQKTESGTYEGTWTIIGTDYGKLKLMTTSPVGNKPFGYNDLGAVEAIPIERDAPTFDEKAMRSIWSYNNAINTLNDLAKSETGILTARSINIGDVEVFLEDKDVWKSEKYGEKFEYDYKYGQARIYCRKILGINEDGSYLLDDTIKTSNSYHYFLDEEGEHIALKNENVKFILTDSSPSGLCKFDYAKFGFLCKTYLLADKMIDCSGVTKYGLLLCNGGKITSSTFNSSSDGGYSGTFKACAVICI